MWFRRKFLVRLRGLNCYRLFIFIGEKFYLDYYVLIFYDKVNFE